MNKQKGITMVSLVIYIASFLVIAGVVGTVTTFFYKNMSVLNVNSGDAADYNKMNIYMIKTVKTTGVKIDSYTGHGAKNIEGNNVEYVTFRNPNETKTTYLHYNGVLYYIYQVDEEPVKEIPLCDNVSNFKVSVIQENGKERVTVLIKINENQYSTTYTLD